MLKGHNLVEEEHHLETDFQLMLTNANMFSNYFKVMFRSVAKRKMNSAINVMGLTTGITFALLIGVFIWSELQVNQKLKDADRLYLLETRQQASDGNMPAFFVPALLGPQGVEQYPTVFESQYRFRDRAITVSKDDKHFRIQSMIGDSTFFEMFGFPVLHGDETHALGKPDQIVITEKIAIQFFNRTDVVGETLSLSTELNGIREYAISAVIEELQQKNSVSDFMNMDAQIFLPQVNRTDFNLGFQDDWNTGIITYIKLSSSADHNEAVQLLNQLFTKNAPAAMRENRTIEASPLSNYYLVTNHGTVQKMVVSLSVIVFFILLLAMVNFINISIASSFSRLKEIGIRKVIGGLRSQVIVQFLVESTSMAAIAGLLGLLSYQLLHGYFGQILGVALPALTALPSSIWVGIIAGTLLIGLLAGSYPSFYLSATQTLESLKGKFKSVKGTIRFSRGLMAVQFFIAIFVFIASLILSEQVSFFMGADLGYNKSGVMVVSSLPRIWSDEGLAKMEVAKQEFQSSQKIKSASLSWGAPNFSFDPYSAKINFTTHSLDLGTLTAISATDEDYARVFGIEVVTGKFFFDDGETFQSNRIVINQTAQKALSAKVGDKVKIQFSDKEFTIAGVVKDFNFESFHEPVKPVAFIHTRDFGAYRYFSFNLNEGSISEAVHEVESVWKKVFPNDPFVYGFTDERLAIIYKSELQLKQASAIGSILILIIVLTGVLGLVSLSVAKRNKEIGIRKVLGASAANILKLISTEYAVLLSVSFAIGIPISYMVCSRWLSNFAYHIQLSWWMFVAPMVILFFTTLLTVGALSIKTALTNPVNSLRYE